MGKIQAPIDTEVLKHSGVPKKPAPARIFQSTEDTYAMSLYDEVIFVNRTVAKATGITLPTAYGRVGVGVKIIDAKGDGETNNITVSATTHVNDAGSDVQEKINGADTLVMAADNQAIQLLSDGLNWYVSGGHAGTTA